VWFDQNLQGGQKWWDRILEEIRISEVFIICLSKNYLKSKACKLEQEYARKLNKTILPILIEEIEELELIDPFIQTIQYVKFLDNNFGSRKALADSITKIHPSPPLPDLLPTPPSVPISILSFIANEIENEELSNQTQEEIFETLFALYNDKATSSKATILLKKLKEYPNILKRISDQIDNILKISSLAIRIENCSEIKILRFHQYDEPVSTISFLDDSSKHIVGTNSGLLFFSGSDLSYNLQDVESNYNLRTLHVLSDANAIIAIGAKDILIRSQLSIRDPLGNPYEHKVGIMEILKLENEGFEKVLEFTDYLPQTLAMASGKDFNEVEEGKVSVWNIYQGLTGNLESNAGAFFCTDINDDNSTLAIGTENRSIIIYDLIWKRVINRLLDETSDSIRSLTFHRDLGLLVAGDYSGSIRIWNYKVSILLNQFQAHSRNITDFAISSKNRTLASASRDGIIKLWDMDLWKQIGELNTFHSGVTSIKFSPLEDLLVAGYRDGTISLWDTKNTREIRAIQTGSKITCLSWSADGALILSGHESGKVNFWTL